MRLAGGLHLARDGDKPVRPWLTLIEDDYSRAVAGYFLFFDAPSTIQTALALHRSIWRKADPRWHVCGIPEVLYTDNGRDFISKHLEQVAATTASLKAFQTNNQSDPRAEHLRDLEAKIHAETNGAVNQVHVRESSSIRRP
jgi:putative transposase